MGEHIVTGVDRLLHLVNERGEISITSAAAELQVERSVLEHWSDFLEERNLIDVKQTLTENTLFSKESSQQTKRWQKMQRFARITRPRAHNQQELLLKEQELRKCRTEIDAKMREFDHLKTKQDSLLALEHRLTKERQSQEIRTKVLAQESTKFMKELHALAQEKERVTKEAGRTRTLQQQIRERENELEKREKAHEKKEQIFSKTLKRIAKLAK